MKMNRICVILVLAMSVIQHSHGQNTFMGHVKKAKEMLSNSPQLIQLNEDLSKLLQSEELTDLLLDANNFKDLETTTLSKDVSKQCKDAVVFAIENFNKDGNWSLTMVDATAKIPPAIRYAAVHWLGGYEMCMLNPPPPNYPAEKPPNSHYCRVYLGKPPSALTLTADPNIDVGVCLPDTCNENDLNQLISNVIHEIYDNLMPNKSIPVILKKESSYCMKRPSEMPFSSGAIVMLVITCLFGVFIVTGSAYDVFVLQRRKAATRPKNVVNSIPSELPNSNGISEANGIPYENLHEDESEKREVEIIRPPSLKTWEKLLLAFSAYTNGAKLLDTSQMPGRLNCIDGIRFISMSWVILGHSFFFLMGYANNLVYFFPIFMGKWSYQALVNATFSVDTFFVLSGLLTSYMFLKEANKRSSIKGGKFWGMYFFHRFWRLTPPYMIFLGFYTTLFKYSSEGPLFNQVGGVDMDSCEKNWWTNLLYVNNIVKSKEMCMGWSWYLANDMQFHYFVAPLILPLIFLFGVLGTVPGAVLSIVCFIVTGVLSQKDKAAANLPAGQAFDDIYVKPWCRVAAYIVGLMMGYLILEHQRRQWKLHKAIVAVGWIIAIGLGLSTVYGLAGVNHGDYKLSVSVAAFYNSVCRFSWSLAVSWVIYACLTGNGGWINTLLSWPGFIPLSRLTYCAYLVHPVVMTFLYQSLSFAPLFNTITVVFWFFGHMIAAYMVAFILSITCESPFIGLERILLRKG